MQPFFFSRLTLRQNKLERFDSSENFHPTLIFESKEKSWPVCVALQDAPLDQFRAGLAEKYFPDKNTLAYFDIM
jgi:hypothetical protein